MIFLAAVMSGSQGEEQQQLIFNRGVCCVLKAMQDNPSDFQLQQAGARFLRFQTDWACPILHYISNIHNIISNSTLAHTAYIMVDDER